MCCHVLHAAVHQSLLSFPACHELSLYLAFACRCSVPGSAGSADYLSYFVRTKYWLSRLDFVLLCDVHTHAHFRTIICHMCQGRRRIAQAQRTTPSPVLAVQALSTEACPNTTSRQQIGALEHGRFRLGPCPVPCPRAEPGRDGKW